MENDELLRRMRDLAARCGKNCEITQSFFLTPAEQVQVKRWAEFETENILVLSGGRSECERRAAFFLPYYMDEGDFTPDDWVKLLRVKAYFGEPGHRDYLGACLGLGIRREWLGDIWISGSEAYIFCLPSVAGMLESSLDKVGRCGVKVSEVTLAEAPAPEIKQKRVTFTVMSPRLDAVLAGMFGVSRSQASQLIAQGMASLNFEVCQKPDAEVAEGDTLSLRGHGKGVVAECGGVSRKGRMFVGADIFI